VATSLKVSSIFTIHFLVNIVINYEQTKTYSYTPKFYDGKPINLKSSSLVANYPGPKYKKVSFSNPGHAENLAKKLNAQHNTDKFGVYILKTGDKFTR
jgi:hypothetical protein